MIPIAKKVPNMEIVVNFKEGAGGAFDAERNLKRIMGLRTEGKQKYTDLYTRWSTDRYTSLKCPFKMTNMNTPDQIVYAALNEFYQHGFHATGVDQLSSAAGVTKRTLYRYFPSKDHLIDAALKLRDEQFFERMETFVEAAALVNRPQAYIAFLAAWGNEPNFHGCAFINATAEFAEHTSSPHVLSRTHKQRILNYLMEICSQLEVTEPKIMASQLFLIGEGLIVATQVMGSSEQLNEVAVQSVKQLIKLHQENL